MPKNRQPWILLSVVVAPAYDERPPDPVSTQDEFDSIKGETTSDSFTDSFRKDICINLNLDFFIIFAGQLVFFFLCVLLTSSSDPGMSMGTSMALSIASSTLAIHFLSVCLFSGDMATGRHGAIAPCT